MRFIGNVIWIICGGLLSALGWWIAGALWCITIIGIPVGLLLCITIIGIPFGKQFFKIAKLSLAPFGQRVVKVN